MQWLASMAETKTFFKCEECSFITPWNFSLSSHLKFSHRTVKQKDFYCNLAFIEKFLCQDCDYRTHMKVEFYNHHDWDNPEFIHEVQDGINQKKWECPECDFKTFSNFLTDTHTCVEDFLLTLKSEIFQEDNTAETPKRIEDINLERSDDTLFYCVYCPYKSKQKGTLKRHIVNRHLPNTKRFKCDKCSFKTSHKRNLKTHIEHCKDKWFYCGHCSYKSNQKGNLNVHVKNMHLPKTEWFKCDQCSFKTTYTQSLKAHIKRCHDLQRCEDNHFYYCGHCPHKSKQKRTLKSHIVNRHLPKTESFKCNQCSFKTSYKSNLKTHIRRCYGNFERFEHKWFYCGHCSYKSNQKGNLNVHVKNMHLPKTEWFECEQCSFKASYISNLKAHVKRRHEKIKLERCENT